ncbi:MAG: GAF domain-containing protein [Spirochaetia bacterium]|nr:GAF domain-containing protein [Spirochaetia bacterium]
MATSENRFILEQLAALIEDWDGTIECRYCHLANASALLFSHFDRINWLGFYLATAGNQALILGPFQGKVACTDISFDRGVCGKAVRTGKSVYVADVHTFLDHIACDSASRSEFVVPLMDKEDVVVGVLDVDSPELSRFSDNDQVLLEEAGRIISRLLWS